MDIKRRRGTGRIYKQRGCKLWYIQYYKGRKRIRESTGSTDRRVAEQKLKQKLAQIITGTFVAPEVERIRVDELFQPYIDDLRMQGKRTTHPQRRWKLHLEPFFGGLRAVSVGTDLLNRYVNSRSEEGAKPATINREMAVLRKMFRLAYYADPPKLMRLPKFLHLKEDNVRLGFIEFDQYQKMRALASPLWLQALVEFYHTYGWRKSEVISLRVRQVDFVAGAIRLDVGTTKNREGREVPIKPSIRPLLADCARGKGPNDLLFTRPDGKPVGDFRKAWRSLCIAAGVSGTLIHDMRRTAARNLRRAGVAESVIMRIGGWKTRSVFERYNIVDQRDVREAFDRLDEARKTEPRDPLGHNAGHNPAPRLN